MSDQIASVVEAYTEKTPKSRALYQLTREIFPSGVTHDSRYLKPYPLSVDRADGSHKWDVDGREYVDYFGNVTSFSNEQTETSLAMQAYLNKISDFEQQQAIRLKAAYGIIGPLLQQYKESDNKKASDEFSDKWQQVHDLRYRIQDEIQDLIVQAKTNVKTGSSAPLILPTYPAFSWE